jgi:hypothetical protein
MRQLDQASFATHVRAQWAKNGIDVSEEGDAPHKEMARAEGWSFGVTTYRDGAKARAGVWFLPPGKTVNDLAGLRNHYQGTLQKQNRLVRIKSCGTELGTVFLFWDSTQSVAQDAAWYEFVDDCTALAFDGDALDEFLESYRT